MSPALALVTLFAFLVGTAIVVALAFRTAGAARTDGSIARVLYDAEHPEKTR